MKDSNLQVVSDWPASNRLHYYSVNTAECFSIYRHISRSVCIYSRKEFSNATLGELVEWDTNSRTRRNWFTVSLLCPLAYPPISKMRFCWTVISHKTGSVIFHVYTHYCAHVRLQLITASSPERYWVEFHIASNAIRKLTKHTLKVRPPALAYNFTLCSSSLIVITLWLFYINHFQNSSASKTIYAEWQGMELNHFLLVLLTRASNFSYRWDTLP